MRTTTRGKIDDDLYLLGGSQVPLYLFQINADRWALVEGGVSMHAADVLQDITSIVGDLGRISHWFITHKHYDHCGTLPYLMPKLHNTRVYASVATVNAWRKPKTREVISSLNDQVGQPNDSFIERMDWADLPVVPVKPGDNLSLGNKYLLHAVATPGHASDQIAYYDPERERLFASDALGEFDESDGVWRPLVFEDYESYLTTLHNLERLRVRQLIPGHGGLFSGAMARNAATSAYGECRRLEQRLMWRLCNGLDMNSFASELHEEWKRQSANFVPETLHLASMRLMLNLMAPSARAGMQNTMM
jgi:glyoxylase-like metal-dependent hydrolase (beta-lactamase superfamily II)